MQVELGGPQMPNWIQGNITKVTLAGPIVDRRFGSI